MKSLNGIVICLAIGLLLVVMAGSVSAADNSTNDTAAGITKAQNHAAIGAALAMGIAGMASAIGLTLAGSAAAASTAENPKNFKNNLILQALPMTQVIYAFVISLIIAMGMGLTGGDPKVDITDDDSGMAAIAVALVVALTGLSAIPQGMVATASISSCSRNPDILSKNLLFTTMPETTALFGFVIGFLIAQGFGFL